MGPATAAMIPASEALALACLFAVLGARTPVLPASLHLPNPSVVRAMAVFLLVLAYTAYTDEAVRAAASNMLVMYREWRQHGNYGRIVLNRSGNVLRERLDWAKHVASLALPAFMDRYKLTPKSFRRCVRRLSPHLQTDPRGAIRAGTKPIAIVLKVAITLRFLAGARRVELEDTFGIDKSTVMVIVHQVVAAINNEYKFELKGPEDVTVENLERLAGAMSTRNGNTLNGCIGALDGMAIKILKPRETCTPNPLHYLNRKGYFSINLQAIADANRKFLYMSMATAGGTHDSLAWSMSALATHLESSDGLPRGYWIAADDAYACTSYLVSPYSLQACKKDRTKDHFNYYQSRSRINVECAFGILVRRWGILRTPMNCTLNRNMGIVEACIKLHNICRDDRVQLNMEREDNLDDEVQRSNARRQDRVSFPAPRDNKKHQNTCTRDALWLSIKAAGLTRPKHSISKRSRAEADL